MMPFLKALGTENNPDCRDFDIGATQEYIDSHRPYYPENQEDAYVEYKSLIELTSRTLLPYEGCLFHGVAFCWHDLAWLFTGRSGVGKTTQYKKWKMLFRDEVQMICGDMPLLERRLDGSIFVRPTPWNGKERMKGKISAPLGGIVLLEQADINCIRRLSLKDSAIPLFLQMAVRPEDEKEALRMAGVLNHILEACPVWKLKNRGDTDSVRCAAEAFLSLTD